METFRSATVCTLLQSTAISVNFIKKGILSVWPEPRCSGVPLRGRSARRKSPNRLSGRLNRCPRIAPMNFVSCPDRSGPPNEKGSSFTSIAPISVQIATRLNACACLNRCTYSTNCPNCIPTLHSITESLFTKNRYLRLPIRPIICYILLSIETSDHGDIILIGSLFIRHDPLYMDMGYLRMLNEWWNLDRHSIYPVCQLWSGGREGHSLPQSYWTDACSDLVLRRNDSSGQLKCKLSLDRERNSLPIKVTAGILGWHSLYVSQALMRIDEDVHEEEIDERVVASSILNQHAQCHDSGH
jgi:hypothetical protein